MHLRNGSEKDGLDRTMVTCCHILKYINLHGAHAKSSGMIIMDIKGICNMFIYDDKLQSLYDKQKLICYNLYQIYFCNCYVWVMIFMVSPLFVIRRIIHKFLNVILLITQFLWLDTPVRSRRITRLKPVKRSSLQMLDK